MCHLSIKGIHKKVCLFAWAILYCVAATSSAQDQGEEKENILFRLFPEDCISIYRLPVNKILLGKQDSVKRKFRLITIASRQKPGLAQLIFDKLSEARIPDSCKYILFKVGFAYTNKGSPYTPTPSASMNTDTLKGIFTMPILMHIVNEDMLPELSHYAFNQPVDESAVTGYNDAVFKGINALLGIYDDSRDMLLSDVIKSILEGIRDSVLKTRSKAQKYFAVNRRQLALEADIRHLDTSLIFGPGNQYGNSGMHAYFSDVPDTLSGGNRNKLDELFMKMIWVDYTIGQLNKQTENIAFLLNEGLVPFSHHLRVWLESNKQYVDEILESDHREPISSLVANTVTTSNLLQLKEKYTDR